MPMIFYYIIGADLALSPIFVSKVDLADSYMCIWFQKDDIPRVDFLSPHPVDI